jgi:hypothetical protein
MGQPYAFGTGEATPSAPESLLQRNAEAEGVEG